MELSNFIRIKNLVWETNDHLKTDEKLLAENIFENIESNIKVSPPHDQEKRGEF